MESKARAKDESTVHNAGPTAPVHIERVPQSENGTGVRKTWALPVPGGWIVYCYVGLHERFTPQFAAITSTFVSDPDHAWLASGGASSATEADQDV